MEINAENLSKFLYEKIKHHENGKNNTYPEDQYAIGYHRGSINAYEKIIKEFKLQRLF